MSAKGSFADVPGRSSLGLLYPSKADVAEPICHVGYGPPRDISLGALTCLRERCSPARRWPAATPTC